MSENRTWDDVRDSLKLGDRLILGQVSTHLYKNNPKQLLFMLARYKHAARLLPQRNIKVLELGCGEGFCTQLLVQAGNSVTGVDADVSAIRETSDLPSHCTYICDDFLDKTYGSFDAVVSLDVIEHIPLLSEHLYMGTICKNLTATGMCIVGTPNESAFQYASEGSKIGHINNYSAQRLYDTMEKYFHNVIILCMNDEVLHTGFYPMAHYLLAAGFHRRDI